MSQFASYSGYIGGSSGGGGSGTVTSVSVVTANGLAGTVANPTTTPAITLSTTITGILQGNGTAISAATTGNLTDIGTDGIVITNGTGAVLGSGTSIAQHAADATHNGYLSSVDWGTFNNKQPAGSYITALTGDGTASGPGSAALTLATVNSNVGSFGDASNVSAVTVNGKGLVTAAASTAIQIAESQVTNLVSDLAGKQATGNYITALTGDVTASGPGSVAATLATVNGNVGSFGSSTSIPSFTVNAKGLITAASGNVVIAPAGTLSGTTLNATVVTSSLTSVGTITSGTWNGTTIAVANGGTSLTTLTANNVILGNGASAPNFVAPGTSGNVLTSDGTTWTSAAATSGTKYAWSGFHNGTYSWIDSSPSGSFQDMPNSVTGTFTERVNINFGSVTTASSTRPGIIFTPAASGITYVVSVVAQAFPAGANKSCTFRIWDGTTEIQRLGVTDGSVTTQTNQAVTFNGLYTSVSTSPVTLTIQSSGPVSSTPALMGADVSNAIEWCIHSI